MRPYIEEFNNEDKLQKTVEMLKSNGVQSTDLYVLTHDDDRTERLSDKANANVIGMKETGLNTAVENFFRKKGDELRSQLYEMGFSETEAKVFEEKLDKGKALLIVKNPEQYHLV